MNSSVPKSIVQVWLGDKPMSDEMLGWCEGIRNLHPEWKYQLWDNAAVSVALFDPELAFCDLKSWASVSNLARLKILQLFGGVYLDTDFECLRPLDTIISDGAFAALQDETRICNAFMAAPPNHPWINWQLKQWKSFNQQDPASGVYLATAAPRDGLTLIDRHLVYPFSYDDPAYRCVAHPDSVLVHRWNKSWRKS